MGISLSSALSLLRNLLGILLPDYTASRWETKIGSLRANFKQLYLHTY